MPTAAPSACLVPGCPGTVVDRGRCADHRRTTSERGYDPTWQAISRAARTATPACEDCGATEDLTVDELLPRSLGGGRQEANRRVRCRSCHAKYGLKSSSTAVRRSSGRYQRPEICGRDWA